MTLAFAAGLTPAEFYRMTVGEVIAYVKAYQERRRMELMDQVTALLRVLGSAFGHGGDPYQGLTDVEPPAEISPAAVKKLRFWRPSDVD